MFRIPVRITKSINLNLRIMKDSINHRFFSINTAQHSEKKLTGLKALMHTHGWTALGIYLALSCIDLPICFFAVHSLGEETIKVNLNKAKQLIGVGEDEQELINKIHNKPLKHESTEYQSFWNKLKESTILTEFLIAYGIHKSLIFIRLPITAAITPAVVRSLKSWGFNLGKFNEYVHIIRKGDNITHNPSKSLNSIKSNHLK